jgi:hypothetical protein
VFQRREHANSGRKDGTGYCTAWGTMDDKSREFKPVGVVLEKGIRLLRVKRKRRKVEARSRSAIVCAVLQLVVGRSNVPHVFH